MCPIRPKKNSFVPLNQSFEFELKREREKEEK
jgi:hypothetical protein